MNNQKGFISIILAVLVAAIVFGGAVFVWQNTTKQAEIDTRVSEATASLEAQIEAMQANLAAEETEDSTVDWLPYENKDLGISFDYPNSWGDVAVKYMDETMSPDELKWPKVFSGKGASINFSSSSVFILLASEDFSSFLGESYNGGQDLSTGCSSIDEDNKEKYCQEINIAGQDAYGYFENTNYECSGDQIKYSVLLNLYNQSGDYSGLKISMFTKDFPIDTDDKSDPCGRPQENIVANLEAIYNKDNLSSELTQQLEEFNVFLESLDI